MMTKPSFTFLPARLAIASKMAVCFPTVPFLFIYIFISLGPKFLNTGTQLSPNGSPQNLHTSLVLGQD